MSASVKHFPPLALAGLTTGVLLVAGGFSAMHEAAEHVLGHPVWSHEFADRALAARIRQAVLAQHPDLPQGTPQDWQACAPDVVARYGETLPLVGGSDERAETPIESLERLRA